MMKTIKKEFSKIGLFLFLGSIIIIAVQAISSIITSRVPFIAENPNLSMLAGMMPTYLIAMPIIFLMFKKIPVTINQEKKKMKPLHILAAFCIAYALMYFSNVIGNIITSVISVFKGSAVDNVIANVAAELNLPILFFLTVICAPLMEELMFRKMLIDRTYKYGEGVSIVFSGLTFGLFHGNLNQFAYAFSLGVFFGFIYVKTKNIVYPVILHMLINFMGSIASTLLIKNSNVMEFMTELEKILATEPEFSAIVNMLRENITGLLLYFGYTIFLLAIVITGVIIFVVNSKKFKLSPPEYTIEKGKHFSVVILNVGMILYCICWLVFIILQLIL